MRKQQQEKYRFKQLETHIQAAGCKTTPEPSPLPKEIILFPGVSIKKTESGIQDILNNFLREIGYVE